MKLESLRINQTDEVKEARCHFLREYVGMLRCPRTEIFYFDWTSFSGNNFQARSWSGSGRKSVVNDAYQYSKLHLLALLSLQGLIAMQYVTGSLNSPIVFDFLLRVLEKVTRKAHEEGNNVVIVLNNSPLNQATAIKNLVMQERFTLLFTAPNSSFLNPVELLFGKLKAGLKTKNSASK